MIIVLVLFHTTRAIIFFKNGLPLDLMNSFRRQTEIYRSLFGLNPSKARHFGFHFFLKNKEQFGMKEKYGSSDACCYRQPWTGEIVGTSGMSVWCKRYY